ncbi:MAG: heme exporter protein CcmD [Thiotrichaceae bacterium]|nr:heme exporter protein CcmD [Thiotrichaceae bacterium]
MGSLPSMGDYGFYIGASYGLALLFMLLEPWLLGRKKRSVIKNVQRFVRINKNRHD